MGIETEIRQRYAKGETPAEIARRYSMTWADVAKICGHVWLRPAGIGEDGMPLDGWAESLHPSRAVIGID